MDSKILLIATSLTLLVVGVVEGQRCQGSENASLIPPQTRILSCLKRQKDRYIRPIRDATIMRVNFTIEELHIKDFDDMNNKIDMELFIKYEWYDYTFNWDPRDYDGLDHVIVSDSYLWVPNYEQALGTDSFSRINRIFNARVFYNGTVHWIIRLKRTAKCLADLTEFPYDRQICVRELEINSFFLETYRSYLRSEKPKKIKMLNSKWNLVRMTLEPDYDGPDGQRIEKRRDKFGEYYENLFSTIILDRKASFYNAFMLAPSIIIPLLILSIFWLPIHSKQRFTLCTFLFMSILCPPFVMQELPTGSNNVPLIVRYCLFDLLLLSITYVTILCSHNLFHHNHTSKVPDVIKMIFFNRVLSYLTSSSLPPLDESYDASRKATKNNNNNINNNKNNNAGGDDDDLGSVLKQLNGYLGDQVTKQTDSPKFYQRNEWRQLAYVIERLIYFLLLICFVCVTATIFANKYTDREFEQTGW